MCLREPLQVVRKLAGPPSTSVSLETHIAARADFVRKNSLPSDRIMVLGAYGPWIALTARRTDVFPYTEHRSIILKEQVERIRRVVLDQNVTHVFGVLPDELKVALENMGFRRLDTFTDGGEEFVSDSSDAFRVEHWARN